MFLDKKAVTPENFDKRDCMVLKTNKLISAIERLTLSETRLIQLAIIGARESGGLDQDTRLLVSAQSYADTFGTTIQNAYKILLEAEEKLFNQTFYYLEDGDKVKTRWVTEVKYKKGTPSLEILLSKAVINEITNIKGYENFFTQYRLAQTSDFTSIYSLRLFELLMVWKTAGKTPIYALEDFRALLGVEPNEYPRMTNFKKRVLDIAIKEINEHTEVDISYEQFKSGRTIIGFSFTIKPKKKAPTYQREKLTYAEAVALGAKQKEARIKDDAYTLVGLVLKIKNENNQQKYWVDDSEESKQAYFDFEKEKSQKRAKKAEENKWVTIGNTRVDDYYIDQNIQKGESREQARARLIQELRNQIELELDNNDVPEHVKYMNNRLNTEG